MVLLKDIVVEISKSVTDAILKHEDVRSILTKTVRLICQKLKVDACSIYTHDRVSGDLVMAAAEGYSSSMDNYTLKVSEGINGHVFTTRRQVNIIHPEKHPSFVALKGSGEEKFHSFFGVPMMAGNSCVGVLAIQSMETRRFHEDIADMSINLASQLAIVVANSDTDRIFKDHTFEEKETISESIKTGVVTIEGVPISSGTVFAPIFRLQSDDYWNSIEIRYIAEDRKNELKKLEKGVNRAIAETIEIQERASKVFIEADASIFFAQLLFLEDPNFISDIKHGIDFHGMEAASSVKLTVEKYIEKFKASNDNQLIERCMDLMDIGLRIVQYLIATVEYPRPSDGQRMIFVGDDIMPSDLMRVSTENILGIACSLGGSTSHAAILAKSLAIPAVMGLDSLKDSCKTGDMMLIDGDRGVVFLNPDKATLEVYREKLDHCELEVFDETLKKPTVTADGKRIQIMGNVCMVNDMDILNRFQNDGVGLYRTEFMYMIHEAFPSENEQYRIFRSIAKMAYPNMVTIRALDIGGDKPLKYFPCPTESDPMLGFRSLRVLLQHREVLDPHLRAMLRASQRGNIKILFPMVAHYEDILEVKKILAEIIVDLRKWYGKKFIMPPIGAMIEMPSTVWQIDEILEEVDFISIGTNDLVQYIFAVDRGNSQVRGYFKPMHPVILKVLKLIVQSANKCKKDVSICGEVAGNPLFIPILIGLGMKEFSMPPMMIAKIKPQISLLYTEKCRELVKKLLKLKTELEVQQLVMQFFDDNNLPNGLV